MGSVEYSLFIVIIRLQRSDMPLTFIKFNKIILCAVDVPYGSVKLEFTLNGLT